jgi:hypothetical protein
MIPELWDFGLTPDQGLKIATIIANWSMVDNEIGHLIQRISGIKDAKDGADLVHVIDLKKKVDILNARRKQGRLPATLNDLVIEMVFVCEKFRPDRNMLAHNPLSAGSDRAIAWSQSKLKALDLNALDDILSESRYATWVAHNLFLAHLGVSVNQLPPRPPVRLAPRWLAEIRWNNH